MNSRLLNKVKMFDMFGKPVTLNVFGKKKHKTLVGAFLSISAMIFFVFAFQKKLMDFLQNMSINVNQRIIKDVPGVLDINAEQLMFSMRFDIQTTNSDKRIPFSFRIRQVIQTREKDSNNNVEQNSSEISVPTVPCTIEHFILQQKADIQVINAFFQDVSVDQYICPQLNTNFTLQGSQNSPLFKYIKIEIVSCENTTLCWTAQEIDEYINENEFFPIQFIFNTYVPNYDEAEYLKSFIYDKKIYRMIPYQMKPITELYFAENDIYTDESWFWFSDQRQESFVMYSEEEFRENTITQSRQEASLRNYGQFLLMRSQITMETLREYEKIDSILSYMGGFIQMVFVLTGFVMEFYNMQSLMLQLANQLYSFETPTELEEDDKDINKFSTRQQFLSSIFKKIFSQVKKLSLNPSYILYRMSCNKILNNDRNILIHQAMKQVDQDLNIFEILDRLHEVDKMKKVLFTEEQKKIFEFSYKPTINLESIYKNMRIKKIQQLEKSKQKNKKKKEQKQLNKSQRKQNQSKVQLLKEQKHSFHVNGIEKKSSFTQNNLQNKSDIVKQSMIDMEMIQTDKPKLDFVEIIQQISYFNNPKNKERIMKIAQLLIEEGYQGNNQHQIQTRNYIPNMTQLQIEMGTFREDTQSLPGGGFKSKMDLQLLKQQTDFHFSNQNNSYHLINQSPLHQNNNNNNNNNCYNNNYNKNNNHNNEFQSSQINASPLQQFLNQNKKKKSDNLLLNLIKELRPQTFYSQRMDYSNFSAFYELYEACQTSTNTKINNRSQIKTTEKILQFLGQDIRDVFQLAVRLPDEQEIQKQERIRYITLLFIQCLKKSIGRVSVAFFQKVNEDDDYDGEKQKPSDLTSNYQQRFNNMNQLNERSDLILKAKNIQTISNISQISSYMLNIDTVQNVLNDNSAFNQRMDDKSNHAQHKENSEGINSSFNSPNSSLNIKKYRPKEILNNDIRIKPFSSMNISNPNKRFSLQFQIISDKNNSQTQSNNTPTNDKQSYAGSSIFRQCYQQKYQARTIDELQKVSSEHSEESDNSQYQEQSNTNSQINDLLSIKQDEQTEQIPSQQNAVVFPQWENKNLKQKTLSK